MADLKISDLTADTAPAVGDLMVTVDISDTVTDSDAAGSNKKVTLANAAKAMTITDLIGTLSTAKGGTNLTTYVLGDVLYSSAADTLARLAGNTTTVKQYLSQTGNGSISAAPAWAQIAEADIADGTLLARLAANENITGAWSFANNVSIGTTPWGQAGKLYVAGDADEVQLQVRAFSTQTSKLLLLETSAGVSQLDVSGTGNITSSVTGGNTIIQSPTGTGDVAYLWKIGSGIAQAHIGTVGNTLEVRGYNNIQVWPFVNSGNAYLLVGLVQGGYGLESGSAANKWVQLSGAMKYGAWGAATHTFAGNSGAEAQQVIIGASNGAGEFGLTIFDGGTNNPAYFGLYADNGTAKGYTFIDTDGRARLHSAVPTSNTVGDLIQHVRMVSKTAAYTATAMDTVILCDATTAAFTVTLPAATKKGMLLHVKKTDAGANAVTISRAGTDTIEGATTVSLANQWSSVTLIADGTSAWSKLATT